MRADKRRLALIERSLASPWTSFRRADGAKVLIPDRMAVDAFLNAIGQRPLGMGEEVEAFLATCDLDDRAPDLEYLVVMVARKNAGLLDSAPLRPNAPLRASVDSVEEMEEEPESGIAELLEEEDRLVRAARSQEWIERNLGAL
jgi:hypothetical protein